MAGLGETNITHTSLLNSTEPIDNSRLNQMLDFTVTVADDGIASRHIQANSIRNTDLYKEGYDNIYLIPPEYPNGTIAASSGLPSKALYWNTTSGTLARVP